MRVGFNPNKDKQNIEFNYFHQVIIPVYIPNFEGYFKESLEIFKISIASLLQTSHSKTYITIVANGCCKEVKEYIAELHQQQNIQEVIYTDKIGKLNAILKGLVGINFDLVTIVDADVLFLNNWQKETYKIFENFSKAGVVCTTPSSRSLFTHTFNLWFDNLLSKKLQFSKVKNPKALQMFGKSVGNEKFYSKTQLKKILTITQKNISAVVGAGHFMCTYRRDIFYKLPKLYTNYALGGTSENFMLDIPVVKKDYWRLSTVDNYTYHLGNTLEDWMNKEKNGLKKETTNFKKPQLASNRTSNKIVYFIKSKLFKKVLFGKKGRLFLLKLKGLNKKEVLDYKA